MKNFFLLILIAICLLPVYVFSGSSRKELPYADIFYKVRKQAACQLAKKYNMRVIGFGEGLMNNINLMMLSFSVDQNVSKNEARSILINSVEDLLAVINQNEEIRPYLAVYPFDAKHVDVTIYIQSPNDDKQFHPHLSVFSAYKGNLNYSTNNPENCYKFKLEEKESFEDAIKILKGEKEAPPSEIK